MKTKVNARRRNAAAVFAGILSGSIANMAIILLNGKIIPLPPGVDFTTAESVTASMPLLTPIHFLMPFLAHAIGTLVGSWVTQRISNDSSMSRSLMIGAFFFAGGAVSAWQIPAPTWFELTDLTLAYFPLAYLGWKWGHK